jgi:hypothetical protein
MIITRPSIEIPWWYDTEEGRILLEASFRVRQKLQITSSYTHANFVIPNAESLSLAEQAGCALSQIVTTKFSSKDLVDKFHQEILKERDDFFEKRELYFKLTGSTYQIELFEIKD